MAAIYHDVNVAGYTSAPPLPPPPPQLCSKHMQLLEQLISATPGGLAKRQEITDKACLSLLYSMLDLILSYSVLQMLPAQLLVPLTLSPMPAADATKQQPRPTTALAPSTVSDTRGALQARAHEVQGGSLTDLLMAWFDAGYQTGRHEALSEQQCMQ